MLLTPEPENATPLIDVRELGNVIFFRFGVFAKANWPIVESVDPFSKFTVERVEYQNAP
jgi:hypothetical protein